MRGEGRGGIWGREGGIRGRQTENMADGDYNSALRVFVRDVGAE